MKIHETTLIAKKIIILFVLINCSTLFGQDNCDLLTYKLYHKVKGEKIYVGDFDSSANYTPSYNELLYSLEKT